MCTLYSYTTFFPLKNLRNKILGVSGRRGRIVGIGKCFIGDNYVNFCRHNLRDWTHNLFNNPFKSDTFYILLFGYQNGVEVIYVD